MPNDSFFYFIEKLQTRDNTTRCSYINKFWGWPEEFNSPAIEIWLWSLDHNIYLSAAHLPGKLNPEADKMSRSFNGVLEWSLSDSVFGKVLKLYPDITMDLFASQLQQNAKICVQTF